ncbi:hypothetical protein ACKXGF_12310 [Alkalibacillus sp. S2W]|uniref:hypothetical protein n=1 Tax=Alkalibacillus sp. S2W TaxID=3386553 RepID=UPI00398D10A9
MRKQTNIHISHPFEREYEAWVVSEIEKYFLSHGMNIEICAVSPKDEKTWPSDEYFSLSGQLIGLQFKRPYLNNLNKIYWDLKERTQFELIKSSSEIYYALPTFINRTWKKEALHHCIFWTPKKTDASSKLKAWYDHSRAQTKYKYLNKCEDAFRWGTFIELIKEREIGYPITASTSIRNYFKTLFSDIEFMSESDESSKTIYFLFFPNDNLYS